MRIFLAIFALGLLASSFASDSDESVDDFYDSKGRLNEKCYSNFKCLYEKGFN
jgi:hypothetical protein